MEIILTSSTIDINDRKIPFRFRIKIQVSLITPTVFEPLYPVKKKAIEVEEVQRRLLMYVFGYGVARPEDYTKNTSVPFFLSCLKAAPALATLVAVDAAQPSNLLATLLPFQKRGVAWLLGREGKCITVEGKIVDSTSEEDSLPAFWDRVYPDEGTTWYLNRITGQLSDSVPSSEDFLGGILADEPGLGKTLESIALILLNPAVDRNPSISRWDPIGVIDVKEIKVRH